MTSSGAAPGRGEPLHRIPSRVGPYLVSGTLGQGAMGTVLDATDERLGRRVALKAIRAEQRFNAAAVERLLREARVLSSLRHPSICGLYDYLEWEGDAYLVLEFVQGQRLGLARAGLSSRQRLRIAEQVADALRAAHAREVVHRDLKPDNVMVTPEGDAKVLDFGIARPRSESAKPAHGAHTAHDHASPDDATLWFGGHHAETSPGSLLGTPAYMSPEQAAGEPATTASDMFAFGLLVQELFTGERPFADAGTLTELLERVRRAEVRPMRGGDRDIRRLVRDLTSLHPATRPTAADTVARLRRIRQRPVRRAIAATGVVLLVIAIAGVVKYTVDLRIERTEAVEARSDAEGLVEFMTEDLRNTLAPVGRLDALEGVATRVIDYYDRRAGASDGALDDSQRLRRSKALSLLGESTLSRRDADLARAESAFRAAFGPLKELESRSPRDGAVLKSLGAAHFWLGNIAYQRGDLATAQREFESYLELARRMVALDESRPEWLLELGYAHSNLVQLHRDRGDLAASRQALEASLDAKRKLVSLPTAEGESQPGEWRRSLANALTYLAEDCVRGGDMPRALQTNEETIGILEALVADHPRNADNRYRLGIAQAVRSDYLARVGRHAEAIASASAAQGSFTRLLELEPLNAEWQRELAMSHRFAAESLAATDDLTASSQSYVAALALLTALVERDPSHARWSGDLRATQALAAALAERLLQLDRVTEARPIVLSLSKSGTCPAALTALAIQKGLNPVEPP